MEPILNVVRLAESTVDAHVTDTVLVTGIMAGVALLLGLWSLMRRRGIRRLRRRIDETETRLRALELAAERRIIDQIRPTPHRVEDSV